MAYTTEFFRNMGKVVACWYELYTDRLNMDDILEEGIPSLNDTVGERALLTDFTAYHRSVISSIAASRGEAVTVVRNYYFGEIRDELNIRIADANMDEILDRLDDAMTLADDCVIENYGIVSIPVADPDNVYGSVCSITDQTQQLHNAIDYEAECYNIDQPGAELWQVKNTDDQDRGVAISNVEFEDELYGVSFLISGIAAVGDQHFFNTTISGIGLLQYFHVQNFDVALPSCASGLNTIPDDWASWAGSEFDSGY